MTTSKEAQEIERRLAKVARPTTPGGRPGAAAGPPDAGLDPAMLREIVEIDRALATLEVPADEWETLYRIRLQVERDLLAGQGVGDAFPGNADPGIPLTRSTTARHGSDVDDRLAVGAAVMVAALLALDAGATLLDRIRRRAR